MQFCFVTSSVATSEKDKGQQEWSPNGAGDRSHRAAACLSRAALMFLIHLAGAAGGTPQKEDLSKTHKKESVLAVMHNKCGNALQTV